MADAQNSARSIDRWVGGLLARYIRFVRRTSSNVEEMDEIVADSIKHHPCIVAMWHGEFLLLPLIKPPGRATDIMLARHTDAAFLGEALKQIRHAIDPRRRCRGSGQGSRRQPCLQVGHPGLARRPRGRDDRRCAWRKSAPRRPRHRHGGKAVGQADPARCHRHQALRRAQLVEPDDDQPALLAPGLRRGSSRACAARGDHGGAGGLPAGGRRRAEHRYRDGLCPGGLRSDAGHARRAACRHHRAGQAPQGLSRPHQPGAAGGAAAARPARAARQGGAAATP